MPENNAAYSADTLEKIARLEYRARMTVDGPMSGQHKSHRRGFNVEFLEHREYYRGDDLKHIDWKVFARRDRFYVKQYEEETNLSAYLLVDSSASMGYMTGDGKTASNKLACAVELAASFAYLFTKQHDACGLAAAREGRELFIEPQASRGQFHRLLGELVAIKAGGRANLADTLLKLSGRMRKKSALIIFSDFLEESQPVMAALKSIRGMGVEPVLFHILDSNELEFPFTRASRFIDPESDMKTAADPAAVRARYLKELEKFIEGYRELGRMADIDYTLARSDRQAGEIMLEFLQKRERRKKRQS